MEPDDPTQEDALTAIDEIEAEAQDEVSAAPEDSFRASLVLKRNNMETDVVFPVGDQTTIGRFDASMGPIDVDLGSIPEGSYVSRRHAKISRNEDGYVLQDLGSSNGTFVLRDDFERIEEVPLGDGDEVAFANARFVFRIASEN